MNLYPFLTKSVLKARISEDDSFMLECAQIMQSRHTAHEAATETTLLRNRAGWMSSHAVRGGRLVRKASEEGLDQTETSQLRDMVSRYSKQLASHFRQAAIAENPALKEIAAVFSAD
jgi:hypothetical protein